MTPPHIPDENFRALLEQAPTSLLIVEPGPDFRIVGVSEQYLSETLTRRDEILGRGIFEAFPDNPDTPEANSTRNLRASLERVVRNWTHDAMAIQRYDVRRADGNGFEARYWSPVNAPVFGPDGELRYIVHRVRNVTDYMQLLEQQTLAAERSARLDERNRQMEAEIVARSREIDAKNRELNQANEALTSYAAQIEQEAKQKDEFLAMLAHELRNPLAGIASAVELLSVFAGQDSRVASVRQVCFRQLDNLKRMVDDLLDVSRVSRGNAALQRTPLDFRDVVENALHATRGNLDGKKQVLVANLHPGKYLMLADPTRLEQVVANLLVNASKYSKEGDPVIVHLKHEEVDGECWAVLQVSDMGRGIPADQLNRIFEMFTQVDPDLDRSRGGLGIGLTLARKLAEMHGGTVRAESAGSGRGSTFTVRLPIDRNLILPLPRRDSELSDAASAGSRILVIEDNADAREMLKALLEAHGHEVEVADNGEEGLQKLLAIRPRAAFIDIGLPGLDGYEVARGARAALDGSGVTLVALSGYSGEDVMRKASEAGFDHQLVKPVNGRELLALLQ